MEIINLNCDIIKSIDKTSNDLVLENEDLGKIQLEGKKVRKLIEFTRFLAEMTDPNTEFIYNGKPKRSENEVKEAYRISINRKAKLYETKILNLNFNFRSKKLDASSRAAMFRIPHTGEECILLLPDNTQETIENEKAIYYEIAAKLLNTDPRMTQEKINIFFRNLLILHPSERCAQSLMHEYGHVLHWRIFDFLNFDHFDKELFDDTVYLWFCESGYIENVDLRVPNFKAWTRNKRILYLKESLVEDYRISLNLTYNNEHYILPNSVCYMGDILNGNLLIRGIEIMKEMLKLVIEEDTIRSHAVDEELDRIELAKEMFEKKITYNWTIGTPSMSKEDIQSEIEETKKRIRIRQTELAREDEAACTLIEPTKDNSKTIRSDKSRAFAYNDEGNSLKTLGRYEEAIQYYDKAISLDENFVSSYNNKAISLEKLEKYEEAIQYYDKAISLDKIFAPSYNGKGNSLSGLNKYEEAIQCYDKAISLDENFAHAYNGKGNALYKLNRYQEAIECYNSAINLDESFAPSYNNKAMSLEKLGMYEEAIQFYTKAINIDSTFLLAKKNLRILNDEISKQEATTYNDIS